MKPFTRKATPASAHTWTDQWGTVHTFDTAAEARAAANREHSLAYATYAGRPAMLGEW